MCLVLNKPLIGFFNLNHASVIRDARIYLVIVSLGYVFLYLNQVFTGLFTAMGAGSAVFRSTVVGLVANIILDPLLIFGIGPVPSMGVAGAAIATVFAQELVFLMFLRMVHKEDLVFPGVHLLQRSSGGEWRAISRVGTPPALQNMLFSFLTMIISRMVAAWGDGAVAVQKVGCRIESISWMTADGFAAALNAFMAQNYGAGKKERIRRGYWIGMCLIVCWSAFTTAVRIGFLRPIFGLLIREPGVLSLGVDYLQILGVAQIFMCVEIVNAGTFQGLGHAMPSTVCGIVGTVLRIPLALVLSGTVLGLNGIWWTITISCMLKGTAVLLCFLVFLHRFLHTDLSTAQNALR